MGFLSKIRDHFLIQTPVSAALRDIGDMDEMLQNASLATSPLNLIDFVGIVHETLDQAGVPFAVSGALALAAHGVSRQTSDLDIVVFASDASKVVKALTDAGFKNKGSDEFQAGRVRIHKFELQSREIDVLDYPQNRDFLEYLLATASEHALVPGKRFKFVSAEGLIVTKLIPFRRKDQMDIDSLKKVKKDLDLDLIKRWCIAFKMIGKFSFMEQDPID